MRHVLYQTLGSTVVLRHTVHGVASSSVQWSWISADAQGNNDSSGIEMARNESARRHTTADGYLVVGDVQYGDAGAFVWSAEGQEPKRYILRVHG